jgi:glycosyltransferase involved in cell wall biosynthesis
VPLVSAIIPTRNRAQQVTAAIDSALAQTFSDLEVVVVDDGSEDATPDVVAAYGGAVRYVHTTNGGPARARNVGAQVGTGEWIAFLDDDDTWLPQKIERQLQAADDCPSCGAVFTDYSVVSGDRVEQRSVKAMIDPVPSGWVFGELFWRNFICTCTVLVRRSVFAAVEGFDESLRQAEDWHLWLRIAARYQWLFVDQVLTRVSRGSRTSGLSDDVEGRLEACQAALGKIVAEFPCLRAQARSMRARQQLSAGIKYLAVQDYVRARRCIVQGLRLDPAALRAYPYLGLALVPRLLVPPARWVARAVRRGLMAPAKDAPMRDGEGGC